MPCDTQREPVQIMKMASALDRLEKALAIGAPGAVTVVIGAQGGIAFRGWKPEDRAGLTDLCAYRKLAAKNSSELRRAIARAEALYGRKLDPQALAAGVHSHDGGHSWGSH